MFVSVYQTITKKLKIFLKNTCKSLQNPAIFALPNDDNRAERKREFSSVGSEHLPYKQRVGGSNPSTPTLKIRHLAAMLSAFFVSNVVVLSIVVGDL